MVIYEGVNEVYSSLILRMNDWWMSLAGGAIPDRSQLDPVDLKILLPNIMIADVETNPFRIRYRLVGTRVVEASGLEYTGRYLDEIRPPAPGEPWIEEYRLAYQRRRPLFGNATITTGMSTPFIYEFSIFPLLKGGNDIAQFISLEDYFRSGTAKCELPPWILNAPDTAA